MFMSDKEVKKFKRYAKDTTSEMFVSSLFPDKFKQIATQCYLENADSYKKLFSDTEFYQKVMEAMAKELYNTLRKDQSVVLQFVHHDKIRRKICVKATLIFF